MLLKRCISFIVALMLFITLPVAVFADEAGDLESLRNDAKGHADDAGEAKQKTIDGDQGGGTASFDDAEKAYSDAKTAADKAKGALNEIDGENGLLETAKEAVGQIEETLDNIDRGAAAPDELVDPFNEGDNAIGDLVGKVEEAVVAADEALSHVDTIMKAANAAADNADNALTAADEALQAAREAEDIYRQMLEETLANGDPVDGNALATAENEMVSLWNSFMGHYDDALSKVDNFLADAMTAQQEAQNALKAWQNAETAYAGLADAVGLKNVAELRHDVLNYSALASMDALEAVIMAVQLRDMAIDAGRNAEEASELVNQAVGTANGIITNFNNFLAYANENYSGEEGLILPNGVNNSAQISNSGVKFGYFTSTNKAVPDGVDTIWLILSDGTEIQLYRKYDKDKPKDEFYFVDPSYADANFAGFPIDNRDGKNQNEYLLFMWKVNGVMEIHKIYGRYDKTGEKDIDKDQKNWHFYGDFGKFPAEYGNGFSIENDEIGTLDGIGTVEWYLHGLSKEEYDILIRAGVIVPEIPAPTPPSYLGGGGGGGGGRNRGGGGVVGGTLISDTPVPLAETPVETIGDIPIPLAGLDTVTIVDENVPLAQTPGSGGLLGMIASNMVTVDMCLPPVSRKRRRYIIKNIRKKAASQN